MISNEKLRKLINLSMNRYLWHNRPAVMLPCDDTEDPQTAEEALVSEIWDLSEEELVDAEAIMLCGRNDNGDYFPDIKKYRSLPQITGDRNLVTAYMLGKKPLPFYLQAGCVNLNIPVLVWRVLLDKGMDGQLINPARAYVYETARKKLEYAVDMSMCVKIAALKEDRASLTLEDRSRFQEYLMGYSDDEVFSLMQIAGRGARSYREALPEVRTAEEARRELAKEVNYMERFVVEGCIINGIEFPRVFRYSDILNRELERVTGEPVGFF